MPQGDPFGYLFPGPMPPLDPAMGLPEDPRRASHQFGLGQAGLALLSTAGSRNYGSNLAQALGAYTSGRGQQMEQFQELARQQQLQQMREAQLALQFAAQERLTEAEERRLEAQRAKEDQAAQERRFYLEQLPEEERGKFALAPLDALKKAVEPEPSKKYIRMDLGDREVLVDPDTLEEVKSLPQGRTPGSGGRQTYRLDLGTRISVRDAQTHEEIESIAKDPSDQAASPKRGTVGQWYELLLEQDPSGDKQKMMAEAEARASGNYQPPPPPPSPERLREALEVGPRARRELREQQERPGASSTPVRTPPTASSAPVSDQIRSALPEALRDDPGVIAAIQRGLAQKKDPQTIIDDLLGIASGL